MSKKLKILSFLEKLINLEEMFVTWILPGRIKDSDPRHKKMDPKHLGFLLWLDKCILECI